MHLHCIRKKVILNVKVLGNYAIPFLSDTPEAIEDPLGGDGMKKHPTRFKIQLGV